MRGPRTAVIAHKMPDTEMLKKRKAETKTTKEKPSKKNSGATKDPDAPKRPASAFFVFMEEFRKSFKENFPENKPVSAATKAGGEKWKSLSDSEKAPYIDKALKRKQEYEKAVDAYKKKLALNGDEDDDEKPEESERSTSEVHDEAEQEASS